MPTKENIPSHKNLWLPVLRAVEKLGGSASRDQVMEHVLAEVDPDEQLVLITYPNRQLSILEDRIGWGLSYCKNGGLLESPQRTLYLMTREGRELLSLPEQQARARVDEIERRIQRAKLERRKQRQEQEQAATDEQTPHPTAESAEPELGEIFESEETSWQEPVLARLHQMSPRGFEQFVIYLLSSYGLELEHTGGSGDGGVDGFGTAPISAVMSATVAVQIKRRDPAEAIGRDVVALFQRDAQNRGAERAIMVTLGRYTNSARKASREFNPTVELIDGEKLCTLMRDKEVGVQIVPTLMPDFFELFDASYETLQPGKAT